MGLKTTEYEIKDLGITLDEAYAQIENVSVNLDGKASVRFKIQQSRNDMSKEAIETTRLTLDVDKSLPLYEQAYIAAKEKLFVGWEDDIVEVSDYADN